MSAAFRGARFARLNAGAKLRAGEFEVGAGEARNDARGREADVGAIVTIADALHLPGHVFLAQTSIGARIACFETGITSRDAFNRRRVTR